MEPGKLIAFIEDELRRVRDDRVVRHVRSLLVEPRAELRDWDYGAPDEKYLCWIVAEHRCTGIAYCEQGFGPRCPWGLISASIEARHNSIGMDSGWFPTFMGPYFESCAGDLPIWRVFSLEGGWPGQPLTDELSWEDAWERCEAARRDEPGLRFTVDHCIPFGG